MGAQRKEADRPGEGVASQLLSPQNKQTLTRHLKENLKGENRILGQGYIF